MSKPGKFPFVENRDKRLALEYAYRSMTAQGLWALFKETPLNTLWHLPQVAELKLRKGSNWAYTLSVMHKIAQNGWEATVEELGKT